MHYHWVFAFVLSGHLVFRSSPSSGSGCLADDPRYTDKLAVMEALLLADIRRLDDPYHLWSQPDDGLDPPAARSERNNN